MCFGFQQRCWGYATTAGKAESFEMQVFALLAPAVLHC